MSTNEGRSAPRRVLGVIGSLRRDSFNAHLLHAAAELAPSRLQIDVDNDRRLLRLPLFDEDVERAGLPQKVSELHDAIRSCDGLVIATPEYNFGVPGTIKNLVDWASRPPGKSPLRHKPVLLMGASTGRVGGTVQAQGQLRISLSVIGAEVMSSPPVLVSEASDRFVDGTLTDATSAAVLSVALERFLLMTDRTNVPPTSATGGSRVQASM